jgi:hypothetical protein
MTILRQGTQNACEIAALMEWDLSYKTWDEFPVQQKWFAIGEVIAHLRYLEQKSLVKRARVENQTGYALV